VNIRILPSLFTVGNLIFGIMSILYVLSEEYALSSIMIIISMILDVLDGRIARRFDVSSDFGKELDSLADVVSFGVAPAILLYTQVLSEYSGLGLAAILWFAVAGALRLARFNVKTTKGYYQGLPITVAGSIIAVLSFMANLIPSPVFLICAAILGYLMISTIRIPKI
jgi:CDP-diacylglycerol--serine O-phosphatidyltransferase